ncbi:hypothetical protein SSS_06017, partial [Sarcoptes scabiei]
IDLANHRYLSFIMTRLNNRIGWLLVVAIILLIYWQPSSSIRNGVRTRIYLVPYTVDLLMGPTICGGAILSSTFVVTAASCVQKYSDVLRKAFFNVKDPDQCKTSTKTHEPTTSEEFCANTNVSLETGDEGDPAVHNARLVGLGSYPPSNPDYPSVFTRVGAFMGWIQSVIHKNGES